MRTKFLDAPFSIELSNARLCTTSELTSVQTPQYHHHHHHFLPIYPYRYPDNITLSIIAETTTKHHASHTCAPALNPAPRAHHQARSARLLQRQPHGVHGMAHQVRRVPDRLQESQDVRLSGHWARIPGKIPHHPRPLDVRRFD